MATDSQNKCKICGGPIKQSGRGKPRKTCSKECALKNRRNITADWWKTPRGVRWAKDYLRDHQPLKLDALISALKEGPLDEKTIRKFNQGGQTLLMAHQAGMVQVDAGVVYYRGNKKCKPGNTR